MKTKLILLFVIASFIGKAQNSVQLKSSLINTIEELKEFVAIPNDALNPADIQKNLLWLTKKFKHRGFQTKVITTEGLPLFFASLITDTQKPTILFYMHFDGQSVDISKWNQENPYKIALKENVDNQWIQLNWNALENTIDYNWRLFGRSTADDKGPIVMFLNAIDLLHQNNVKMPFNIKVILDSEEEKSSKPLPKAVRDNFELLAANFLVINDGPVHHSKKPTLIFGCRGITTLSITTYGPLKPQHSGHFGNYAPNPVFKLAHLLSSMKDKNGKVIIPGYYNGISIDSATQKILKSVPDDIATIHKTLAIKTPETVGLFYQESLQYPSLNVRGISAGWVGKQARTIVPDKAIAEIDLRLVPETNGDRLKSLVKKHIKNQGYYITSKEPTLEERTSYSNIVTIKEGSVTNPFRTPLDNKYGIWISHVLSDTFNEDVVKIRIMGGTVPISPFINTLKIPAFIVPLVNPDNNQHSPNENLKIGQIAYGINVYYNLLSTSIN